MRGVDVELYEYGPTWLGVPVKFDPDKASTSCEDYLAKPWLVPCVSPIVDGKLQYAGRSPERELSEAKKWTREAERLKILAREADYRAFRAEHGVEVLQEQEEVETEHLNG